MEDQPLPAPSPIPQTIAQDTNIVPGKSSKFKKVLIAVGIVVLVVVLAEAGYQLRHPLERFFNKPADTTKEVSTQKTDSEEVSPTPEGEGTSIKFSKVEEFTQYLEVLNEKKGFLDRAVIESTISGIVMLTEEENIETGLVRYVFKIRIRNSTSEELNIHFTENQFGGSSVTLLSPEGNSIIRLTDIKAGDKVTIREAIDLLDNTQDSRVVLEVERL